MTVLDFGSTARSAAAAYERYMIELGDADRSGPLPCGCYRIEVYDFGHDPSRCTDPETDKD